MSGGEATPNEIDGLDVFFNATVKFPKDPGLVWQIDFHVPADVSGNKIILDADAGQWDGAVAIPGPGDGLPSLELTLVCPCLGDATDNADTDPSDDLPGGNGSVKISTSRHWPTSLYRSHQLSQNPPPPDSNASILPIPTPHQTMDSRAPMARSISLTSRRWPTTCRPLHRRSVPLASHSLPTNPNRQKL